TRITDDQVLVAVEHAEALRHVVDCRLETHVLVRELALALTKRVEMVLLDRDILVGCDEGKIRHPAIAHPDRSAVGEDFLADEGRVPFEPSQFAPVTPAHFRGTAPGEM